MFFPILNLFFLTTHYVAVGLTFLLMCYCIFYYILYNKSIEIIHSTHLKSEFVFNNNKKIAPSSNISTLIHPSNVNNQINTTNITPTTLYLLIKQYCPTLTNAFKPSFFLPLGFLQTYCTSLNCDPPVTSDVEYYREIVTYPDGGISSIDWAINTKIVEKKNKKACQSDTISPNHYDIPYKVDPEYEQGLIILLHGLAGGSEEHYLKALVKEFLTHDYKIVVINYRGCSNTELKSPKLYAGEHIDDIKYIIEEILISRFGIKDVVTTTVDNNITIDTTDPTTTTTTTTIINNTQKILQNNKKASLHSIDITNCQKPVPPPLTQIPFIGVGCSLGANLLVNYLGVTGLQCPLICGVSLANPFDLHYTGNHLCRGNFFTQNTYLPAITSSLKGIYGKHSQHFINVDISTDDIAQSQNTYEFAHHGTCALFRYRSIDEYHRYGSCVNNILNIRRPTLFINANDDPISPYQCFPFSDINANPFCIGAITSGGGHLGWYGDQCYGKTQQIRWHPTASVEFINMCLYTNVIDVETRYYPSERNHANIIGPAIYRSALVEDLGIEYINSKIINLHKAQQNQNIDNKTQDADGIDNSISNGLIVAN